MSTELYILEWKDQQPSADEVKRWLIEQGFVVEGRPTVYANGTLSVECEPDPTTVWATYTPEDGATPLATHVEAAVGVRAELLAIPEAERSLTQRGLLAAIELMLYGFGVRDS